MAEITNHSTHQREEGMEDREGGQVDCDDGHTGSKSTQTPHYNEGFRQASENSRNGHSRRPIGKTK